MRDSPGSGCAVHLLSLSHSVASSSLRPRGLQHARLPCPSLSSGVCNLVLYTSLSPPDTSTAEHHFRFGPAAFLSGSISNCPSLFPSSILDTFQPGGLIFRCHIFFLFILFLRFSRQECWSGLPFPPPVDHDLSEWSYDHLSWVALQSMVHSFIELHNPFSMTRL